MLSTYGDRIKHVLEDRLVHAAEDVGERVRHAVEGATVRTAARGVGWASIAVGLTEIVAAERLDRFLGTGRGENAGVFRVLGVREVCHGIDILTHPDPAPGVWSRVAGDALDGVLLGVAAAKTRRPAGVLAAAALVLPLVLADLALAPRLSRVKSGPRHRHRRD